MKALSKDAFPTEDGPFVRALDETLASMNVHREAYYGGTFVGNHAHRCLKVQSIILYCKQYHFKPFIILGILQAINIDKISASIPQVARRCPQMEEYAQTVANKFGRALLLFSKCHNQFNSKKGLSEDDLDTLG